MRKEFKLAFVIAFATAGVFTSNVLNAQVTIGGDEAPAKGAILDLNSDTKGGLLFSNVEITDFNVIPIGENGFATDPGEDGKAALKGMVVYNTKEATGEGLYVWNGTDWIRLATPYTTTEEVEGLINASLQRLHPVGSIYTSTELSSPEAVHDALGFGNWLAFGEGQVLVGKGGGAPFNAAGNTGGSKDAIIPYHTHIFRGTPLDTHTHLGTDGVGAVLTNTWAGSGASTTNTSPTESTGYLNMNGSLRPVSAGTPAGTNDYVGTSGNTVNANLQPYIVVYMYVRTAD